MNKYVKKYNAAERKIWNSNFNLSDIKEGRAEKKQVKEDYKKEVLSKIPKVSKDGQTPGYKKHYPTMSESIDSLNHLRYILNSDDTSDRLVDELTGSAITKAKYGYQDHPWKVKPDTKKTLVKIHKLIDDLHQEHRLALNNLTLQSIEQEISRYRIEKGIR